MERLTKGQAEYLIDRLRNHCRHVHLTETQHINIGGNAYIDTSVENIINQCVESGGGEGVLKDDKG